MECEQYHSELDRGSFRLGHYNTFLDQTAPATDGQASEWSLTTYLHDHKEPTAIRLCFSLDDNNGDVDCVVFTTFKVKPPGATATATLPPRNPGPTREVITTSRSSWEPGTTGSSREC